MNNRFTLPVLCIILLLCICLCSCVKEGPDYRVDRNGNITKVENSYVVDVDKVWPTLAFAGIIGLCWFILAACRRKRKDKILKESSQQRIGETNKETLISKEEYNMSLSPSPQVKITYSTAREICDDIWAGTIHFAKEAGFSIHPLVATVLWSGLLLSVKKELDAHDLLHKVQEEFIHSFSRIYDYGPEAAEQKADLENRMRTFYDTLSEGVVDLETELQILEFVSIAINVNTKFSPGSEVSLVTGAQIFSRTTSLLSSHIYNILRNIDSEILLQFPDPSLTISPPTQPHPAPQPTKSQHTGYNPVPATTYKNRSNLPGFVWFCAILVFFLLAAVIVAAGLSSWGSGSSPKETDQTPQLEQQARPQSGELLLGSFSRESEITITTTSYEDCVVMLKNAKGVTKLAFYVRAGDTVTVGVPAGYFYVYFASGEDWYGYGEGLMFGDRTSYSMDDELLDFTNYTWTYTLRPVTDGNFSETPIDEDEFFN